MFVIEVIKTAFSWSDLASDTMYADILSRTSTWEMVDFIDVVVLKWVVTISNENINTETPEDYVKLLIHSDTTDGSILFTDSSSSQHTVNRIWASHQIEQSKFGQSSILLSQGALSIPASEDFNFWTDDFTIDYWSFIYTNSNSVDFYILNPTWTISAIGIQHYVGRILFYVNSSSYYNTSYLYPFNQWVHNAFVRDGNTIRYFANGIEKYSIEYTEEINGAGNFIIGHLTSSLSLDWYIDEFRISKWIARRTENFTPPTEPYWE